MSKKIYFVFILVLLFANSSFAKIFQKDVRSREIKYQYNVLKEDAKYKKDGKILNIEPSGYMTVEEYEKQSEYRDKSTIEPKLPVLERPSDFIYVPKPLYSIVMYNNPPGSPELVLGKKLFAQKQINAQGIVSPDYSKLVYPAVYYYGDSASVGCDLFVIPLTGNDSNLVKILKANVARRIPEPILSTDKLIDNYAAFRTLTPVDFSPEGNRILVKEKLGSSEDGIWETRIYIYDFDNNVSYDLNAVREAISYFWKEYMKLNLIAKRWDIVPLGFDANDTSRVVVQAYAYTGDIPIYLGAWSIDVYGEQSRLVSFETDFVPSVSSNGFKIIREGVEEYTTVKREEKALKKSSKIVQKQAKKEKKNIIREINDEYKFDLKALRADYKDDYRDNKKLQSIKGSPDGVDIYEAYEKYLQTQLAKDIKKTEKKLNSTKKKIDKINSKIEKLNIDKYLQNQENTPSEEADEELDVDETIEQN